MSYIAEPANAKQLYLDFTKPESGPDPRLLAGW
jgi:hypothetical protein